MRTNSLLIVCIYLIIYPHFSFPLELTAITHINLPKLQLNNNSNSTQLIRPKRFLPFIFAGLFYGFAFGAGFGVLATSRGKRSVTSLSQSEVDMLRQLHHNMNDYNATMRIIQSPQFQSSDSLKNMVIISKNGLNCDRDYCEKGPGMGSIGICTNKFCICSNQSAHEMQCADGNVYDPLNRVCDRPINIPFCQQ